MTSPSDDTALYFQPVRTVYCGRGKFVLYENDVVHQFDHEGRVVGVFRASDTPTLKSWLLEAAVPPGGDPRGRYARKPLEAN